jgi:ADP-heptose:LPS heptosyltransferase
VSKKFDRLVLRHRRAPGDIICLTALVRDIKAAYPDVQLDLDSTCMELWDNNPHLNSTPLWNRNTKDPKITVAGTRFVNCNYGQGIKDQKKETVHFVSYFHRDFEQKTGLHVPLTLPYGDVHLSEHERTVNPITGRYWVMLSGGKTDFTIKVWHSDSFQSVVCQLRERGIQVVQLGDNQRTHWHPTINGTLDLRGKTSLRDMLQIIHHSDGVICGVTAAMHMAAALQRPCVCIAGGREAWYWEAYVKENAGLGGSAVAAKLKIPHRFLHTIGLLECCKDFGCWRNKVVKINEDNMLCRYPIHTPVMPVAKCMAMITPHHVIEAVESYYYDGTLQPYSNQDM